MLSRRVIEDSVDDGRLVEASDDREPWRNRGRFEAADFLHPPDVQLEVRAACRQRMQAALGAPGQDGAEVGAPVVARGAGKPGQVGGDRLVEPIGCLPGFSGDRGKVMLDHAQTVRWLGTAANTAGSRHPLTCAGVLLTRKASETDGAMPYRRGRAKAGRILAALKRDGWLETRRSGFLLVALTANKVDRHFRPSPGTNRWAVTDAGRS
jgi:hypothetical protein